MVHETSYRGVRSGNTLRAFNSRYSRRYHAQSCIVSRISPELIQKLMLIGGDRKADDDKTAGPGKPPRNVAANVPLSLNKQARWLLPLALIRQISSNDIADPGLTVSVTERHKLKRRACCVSFHSNSGEGGVRHIQPGRYFGISHPRADGKSRRTLRRERKEELSKLRQDRDSNTGKVMEAYTRQGPSHPYLGKSEVRYEVYYPCPSSSSIAHNPKYIRPVDNTSSEEPDQHVQHGRPKKRHRGKQRKSMSLKDLDVCDLPSFQLAADLLLIPDYEELECEPTEEDGIREKENATDCLLTTLIEKAQRLQNFKGIPKPRRRKRSGKSTAHHEDDKSHIVYVCGPDTAPAVVPNPIHTSPLFCPVPTPLAQSSRILLPKDDVTATSLRDRFKQRYLEAACKPRKFVLDITGNVQELLKKLDIPARVAEKFGEAYLVCVHDRVYDDEYDVYRALLSSKLHEEVLPPMPITDKNQDLHRGTAMSLINRTMDFVEGLATKLKDKNHFSAVLPCTFKLDKPLELRLNSHHGSAETYVPSVQRLFRKGSADVSDVDVVILPSLSDLLLEDSEEFCEVCYEDVSPMSADSAASTSLLKCGHRVCDTCWARHIHTRLGEGFVRMTCPGHDCQQEVALGVLLSLVSLPMADKLLQRQEEVRIGASATEKWCPNPACGRVIHYLQGSSPDEGNSPPLLVSQQQQQQLLQQKQQQQQDVVCGCGSHVCFQCLDPAHWPASCRQAHHYRSTVHSATFPDRLAEVYDDSNREREAKLLLQQGVRQKDGVMLVEGKHCPRCRTFVNKNGGCPQMVCRCGQLFCWYCAAPGLSHPNRKGCVSVNREKALTTTLVVRHLEEDQTVEEAKWKAEKQRTTATMNGRGQRTSLLERAAEHRRQRESGQQHLRSITMLVNKVASAIARDPALTQQILQACRNTFPSSSSFSFSSSSSSRDTFPSSSSCFPSSSSSSTSSSSCFPPSFSSSSSSSPPLVSGHRQQISVLLEAVTIFLRNAARSQQELHRVVEYSLVLLKDLPDSLLRRRALRISEDLGAFCSFSSSIFDAWNSGGGSGTGGQGALQAVKAVLRLAEIQGWVQSALDAHIVTVRKLRALRSSPSSSSLV